MQELVVRLEANIEGERKRMNEDSDLSKRMNGVELIRSGNTENSGFVGKW